MYLGFPPNGMIFFAQPLRAAYLGPGLPANVERLSTLFFALISCLGLMPSQLASIL